MTEKEVPISAYSHGLKFENAYQGYMFKYIAFIK